MKLGIWGPPALIVGAAGIVVTESRFISDATWAALIGGLPAIITSIVAALALWRTTQSALAKQEEATTKLEKQINSNLEKQFEAFKNEVLAKERLYVAEKTDTQDKLIVLTAKASKAEGKEEERVKTAAGEKQEAPKPTVEMEVKQMDVDVLNAPKKK